MINATTLDQAGQSPRSKRLRVETHAAHDVLDQSIMRAASFADLSGYGRFIEMQYLFHREIEEARTIAGARAAFAHVQALVDARLG